MAIVQQLSVVALRSLFEGFCRAIGFEPVAAASDAASPDYATHDRAESSLRDCGQPVLTSLKAALTKADDIEVRHRLRRLLTQVGGVTPTWLRQQRAVLALELRASPEARRLLQRLADGAPGAWLTDEAAGALRRLAARGP